MRVKAVVAAADSDQGPRRYSGIIAPRHEAELGFRVAGQVIERRVRLGDRVRAGAVLARLDVADFALASKEADASVVQARAQAQLAASDLARAEGLQERRLVSVADVDRQRAAAAAAAARVDAAEATARRAANAVRYATLESSVDGVVTAVRVETGQVVAAGDPVFSIARTDLVDVRIDVPEAEIASVRIGQRARLQSDPGVLPLDLKVREIAAAADPRSRTFEVRLDAGPPRRDGLPAFGSSARVELLADTPAGDPQVPTEATTVADQPGSSAVARVPAASLASDTRGTYVLVLEKGIAARRDVRALRPWGDADFVVEGLAPGTAIVGAGARLIPPGSPVTPISAPDAP